MINNDYGLLERIDFVPSDLYKFRDSEMLSLCRLVFNEASSRAAELSAYGLKKEDLDMLKNRIKEFGELMGAPRAMISERAAMLQQLRDLFKEGNGILMHKLDKMMVLYKKPHPHFYRAYKNARVIIDRGKGWKAKQ